MQTLHTAILPLVLLISGINTRAEEMQSFSFNGLRLNLPAAWASKAHGRIVAAAPLYNQPAATALKANPLLQLKAGYDTMPRHLELSFDALADFPVTDHWFKPELTVHPGADYISIYHPAKDSIREMTQQFDRLWLTAHKKTVSTGGPLPFIPALDEGNGRCRMNPLKKVSAFTSPRC
jgi:hypothetical protein